MTIRPTKQEHNDVYDELCAVVDKYTQRMSKIEILAIASNIVGKLVAMQDQMAFTPDQVMEIVAKNIELGNRQVISQLVRAEPAGHA